MTTSNPKTKKTFFQLLRSWNYAEALEQYLVLSSLCQSRACLIQAKAGDASSYHRRLWYLRMQILRHYVKNSINFPVIFFKLLLPSFFTGSPNIWVNLKSILTRAEFHPLRMAILSWALFSYVLFQGGVYYWQHAEPAYTASYTWTQTAWTTSSTDTGIHPTDQTGWVKYSSVDTNVATGTALTMVNVSSSITQNNTTQFSNGTYSNTTVASNGLVMVALGRAASSFTKFTVDSALTSANNADAGDLDGDGDTDVAAVGNGTIAKYINNGSQSFTKSTVATVSSADLLDMADIDADGDQDIVAGSESTVNAYKNNGSATFSSTAVVNSDNGRYDLNIGDLDSDGDGDVIFAKGSIFNDVTWSKNNGSSFAAEATVDSAASGPEGVTGYNVDGDSDMDVLVADNGAADVLWYENNGSQSFTKRTIDASLTGVTKVNGGDIDLDGDKDVVAVGGSTVALYTNNGSQSFTKTTIDSSLTGASDALISDIDGDGDGDILAVGSGSLAWYANNGSLSFTKTTIDSSFTGGADIRTADINSDGYTDLLGAAATLGAVNWYRQIPSYVSTGSYTSSVLDAQGNIGFGIVSWTASTSAQATITVKIRTSNNSDMSGATAFSSCTAITNGADISSNSCVTDGQRYIQYQLTLATSSDTITPEFTSITINFLPPLSTLTSSAFNTNDSTNVLSKIQWTEALSAGTDVKFQIRTAPDSGGSPGTWTSWFGPSGTSDYYTDPTGGETIYSTHRSGNDDQWIQYKVFLSTSASGYTPTVSDVTLTYVVNAPPEFQSVSAVQNSNGTVSIAYTVRDPDTTTGSVTPNEVTPSFQYSVNNGSSWTSISSGLSSGATSTKSVEESNYTLYTTTWDASAQIDGTYAAQTKIRVTVNDGEAANSTASSTSAAFALDLKDPVPGGSPILVSATTTPARLTLSASDDSSLEMRISTNSDFSGASWSSYSSTSLLTLPTDPATVYVQFRDAYGNTSSAQSATTPETPSNLIIRDVSNSGSGEYQLFVAWKVVDVPTPGFGSYQIWSSSDGNTYSLLSTAGSRTLNYTVQFNLTQGATYYYKVATVDASGNASAFSAAVSDSANGQGGTDVTAPTISSVTSTPSTQTVTITWDTDELANSTVQYSTSPSTFTSELSQTAVVDNSAGVGAHSVTLTGLTPGTTYYYRILSTDPSGNTTTDSNGGTGYTFTTLSGPRISDVAVAVVSNTTASVTWNTDSVSDTAVSYATSSSLSGSLQLSSSESVTAHTLTLTGLTRGTRYYFSVSSGVSTDTNGGSYYTFLTTNDTTAPVITSVSSTLATDVDSLVAWTTDEISTSQVSYSTTTGSYVSSTAVNSGLDTNHSVRLTSLTPNTTYYYTVSSVDASGNSATSTEYTFTTLEQLSEESAVRAREAIATAAGTAAGAASVGGSSSPPRDTALPQLSSIAVSNVTSSSVKISWNTDEPSDTLAQFGVSAGYGAIAGTFDRSVTHSITLSHLLPGITYHYRVTSQDEYGNRAFAEDAQFVTTAASNETQLETTPSDTQPKKEADESDVVDNQTDEQVPQEDPQLLAAAISKTLDLINRIGKQVSIPLSLEKNLSQSIQELAKSVPPPLLSGRPSLDIGATDVTISWNTDKEANSMVAFIPDSEYVATGGYSQVVGDPESFTLDHRVAILGLKPSTKYHYQIRSKTPASGVSESSDFIFTTRDQQSEIQTYAANVESQSAASFEWDTNIPTDTRLSITPYRDGKLISDETRVVTDKSLSTKHTISTKDLEAGVAYDIELAGNDVSGNTVSKVIRGFLTDNTNAAPVVSQVQTDSAISPGQEGNIQTVISWVTNEPSTSRVYYQKGFSSSGELKEKTPLDLGYVKKHVVVVTNFEPGAVYQFKVESMDTSGNPGYSKNFTILTPRQKESVFQVIFRNAQDAFGWVGAFQGKQ